MHALSLACQSGREGRELRKVRAREPKKAAVKRGSKRAEGRSKQFTLEGGNEDRRGGEGWRRKGAREKAIPNEDESTVKFTSVRPSALLHCSTRSQSLSSGGSGTVEGDRESDGVVNKRYDFRRQIWERAGTDGGTAGGWLL